MKVFDVHTDILIDVYNAAKKGDLNRFRDYHVKQLKENVVKAGVWTLYSPNEFNLKEALKLSLEHIDFKLLPNFKVILGLESLRNLKSLEEFEEIYEMGFRHAMLTWNEENTYATGVKGDSSRGITEEGYKVLDFMIDKDMIIDLSHLNRKSFYDVIKYTNKNIIASHSNIDALREHNRNLDDNQLKALKEADGLLGLTLAGGFVAEDKNDRTISKFMDHLDYAVKFMGTSNVCFGFDFMDYFEEYQGKNLNEISDVTKAYKIIDAMKSRGYTLREINDIAYNNFYKRFKHHIINK